MRTGDPTREVDDSNVIENRRLVRELVEIGRIEGECVHHLRPLRLEVNEVSNEARYGPNGVSIRVPVLTKKVVVIWL